MERKLICKLTAAMRKILKWIPMNISELILFLAMELQCLYGTLQGEWIFWHRLTPGTKTILF
jgi:hypothetical protein